MFVSSALVLRCVCERLGGAIPVELECKMLQRLYLGSCKLVGSIPAAIGQLVKLEVCYLAGNNLSGEIPASFGDMTSLKSLCLHNNDLTGMLPSLNKCKKLHILTLLNNEGLQVTP